MIVDEQHYDDDGLMAFLDENQAEDEHLSACAECRDKLETLRLIAESLSDEAVWDERPLHEAPVPETIATLRAFADRMAFEDAEAVQYLPDLLSGPRETWMENLRRHPEYRTAGVVRGLIQSVQAALGVMPRDAVELTALAIEIADHLDVATPQLRGAAWREYGFALVYTGDFAAAEKALYASESHFKDTCASDYDLARVGIVWTSVERGLEKYPAAMKHARMSASQFELYADGAKHASARLAEATILLSSGDYAEARSALSLLKNDLFGQADTATYARVVGNLGYCCGKLGRLDEALQYFDDAARILEEIGFHSDATRTRWNAARILAGEGRFKDALPRLRMVSSEFERLGMMASATQASLEIAEVLVTDGAFDEVEEICRIAIRRFESSSLTYTAPALTALALMQEAVKNRTATGKLVFHVREYLRRVPDEPQLLFAFPAE